MLKQTRASSLVRLFASKPPVISDTQMTKAEETLINLTETHLVKNVCLNCANTLHSMQLLEVNDKS